MHKLLLIGAHAIQADIAASHGIEFLMVEKPSGCDLELVRRCPFTLISDYEALDRIKPVITTLHEQEAFASVLSLTETGLEPAAVLNEHLGLRGVTVDVVRRTRNKWLMRQHLRDRGFCTLAALQTNDPNQASAFASEQGYPLIAKPIDGRASQNINLIQNDDDLRELFRTQLSEKLIFERYIGGKEYSVEAFSVGGAHRIIAITEKFLYGSLAENAFVEQGHLIPARLPRELSDRVEAHIIEFLTVMGITGGPSHTEIKIEGDHIFVIETHTRIGGDHINDLINMTTGVNLLELSLLWAAGKIKTIDEIPSQSYGAACIQYFYARPGIISNVHGNQKARFNPGIVDLRMQKSVGDHVPPIQQSRDRIGYVIASGETSNTAFERARDVLDKTIISTI